MDVGAPCRMSIIRNGNVALSILRKCRVKKGCVALSILGVYTHTLCFDLIWSKVESSRPL